MRTIFSWRQVGVRTTIGAIVIAGLLVSSPSQAQDPSEAALIQQGLQISPVPLNLAGRNVNLVGLGSYIMNAASDCNSCHNSGGPPDFDFASGANPYNGQKAKLNPAVYLGGGQDFGPVNGDPNNPGPEIITRNLTPDKTGMPAGGHTLAEFKQILRTGIDFDHLHPSCSKTVTTSCAEPPLDGEVLQIMPWPTFANMTDHYIEAIYEYLSAIPCVAGPDDPTNPLHNDCGTAAIPAPTVTINYAGSRVNDQNVTVSQKLITLDASKSIDPSGLPLRYTWTSSGPSLVLTGASSSTAQIQLEGGAGQYAFTVTATDSGGAKASATVTITYYGR